MVLLPPSYIDADSILNRMKATLMKSLSVDFTVSQKGSPIKGTGTFIVQRPLRMRVTIKFGNDDFEGAYDEDGVLELSRVQRVYMETGPLDRLYQPSVHFTELPEEMFPLIILAADPREMMADAGNAELAGTEKIGSATCDHLKTKTYDVWIAPDGRLLRFKRKNTTFDFTNYKIGATPPRSAFELAVPAGFRPFVLPRETLTYQAGDVFPAANWVTLAGAPATFETGKPYLAVVTSGDCEVSGRAKGALNTLKSDLPVWVLTDTKAPAGLEGLASAKDKSGRTQNRLFVPVTPFFFLVDKDGRVKKLWMGFDSKSEEQFVKEVRAEIGK